MLLADLGDYCAFCIVCLGPVINMVHRTLLNISNNNNNN